MMPLGIILFVVGIITLVVISNSTKKHNSKPVQKSVQKSVQKKIQKVVSVVEPEKDVEKIKKVDEDPHDAFPQMTSEEGDADAEFASAFTYENLQDSMITSVREARQASKSRPNWSRFGERSNPEIWEAQMAELKNEIVSSGKTFEEFAESSWGPIPEQMAEYWKTQQTSELPETKSHKVEHISKSAMSEAPALTRDAVQEIGKLDSSISRMNEILSAKKRAKSLKLNLPSLSEEQKKDINYWAKSASKNASSVANALIAF